MKCPVCGDKLEPFMNEDEDSNRQLTAVMQIGDLLTQGDFFQCGPDAEGGSHMIAIFRIPVILELS